MTSFGQLELILSFSMIVSAFGFLAITALALYNPGADEAATWRKPVVGSIFASICLVGVILALFPRRCSGGFAHQKEVQTEISGSQASNAPNTIKGHHHNCSRFLAHTIQVKGHVFCAACTGLFLGGLGALFGNALYFFAGLEAGPLGLSAVAVGATAIISGFFQLKFSGLGRLILNMLFVLGGFLILAGLDELTNSFVVDLFTVVLIVFWIFTRILLSQWDHWRTCRECPYSCEAWDKRKVGSISSA